MAKIKGIQEFVEAVPTASITPPLPDHAPGDLLMVFVVGDGVITEFAAAGWTVGGQNQSAGLGTEACRAAWIYKIAQTSNEFITISSASTAWTVTLLTIEGVDQVSPINISNDNGILISADPGENTPFAAESITTSSSNTLVFYTMFNSQSTPSPYPGIKTVSSHDSGTNGLGIGAYIQSTSDVTGSWNFYTESHTNINQNSVSFTIAVANDPFANLIEPYLNKEHAQLLTPFRGASPSINGESWNTINTGLYNNFPQLGRRLNKAVLQYDSSEDNFVEVTSQANDYNDNNFDLLVSDPDTGDYIAFCSDYPFASLSGVSNTLGTSASSTWEVLNGSVWTQISVTFGYWLTVNWVPFNWPEAPTERKFSMVISPADIRRISAIWKPSTLNGIEGYWMRNVYTTVPSTVPEMVYMVPSEGPPFFDAIGQTANTGANPFHFSASTTPATYLPSRPGLSGTFLNLSDSIAPVDLSNKLVVGTWAFGSPKNYVDVGARSELSGVSISFFDAEWNDRTYFIGGYRVSDTDQDGRNIFSIQWNAVNKTYNDLGIPVSDVTAVGLFARQIRGTGLQNFNQLVAYDIPKLAGGTPDNPINTREFLDSFSRNYYPIPLIDNNICVTPIQLGGFEEVSIVLDSLVLTFAGLTSELNAFDITPRCLVHADPGYLGLIFDGQFGDTIKLTNSVLSSPNSWRFEFLNSASSGCIWDFSNTTVINADVTLKPVTIFDTMTFGNCATIELDGCTISNTVFQNCGEIQADGATLIQNIFAASTGASSITVNSVTDIENIQECRFWNSSVAIKITEPGTYDFNNLTFSGNSIDVENASTGEVIIRNINGSDATTFDNTNGGTTTIVEPFEFEITNIIEGTEIRIITQSDLTELAGAEIVGASPTGVVNARIEQDIDNTGRFKFIYPYNYLEDIPVFVIIFNVEYKALRIPIVLRNNDSVIQASQQIDRQYFNPE